MIEYCSPTLAGIKSANLFGILYQDKYALEREVRKLNSSCNAKGVFAKILTNKSGRALIYVYRKKQLEEILNNRLVWELLYQCGYRNTNTEDILDKLSERIELSSTFPHEIGIFLGYPYCDVKGFIEHTGKDLLFCGHWKVYENESKMRKLFEEYDVCKECYIQKFLNGMSVTQLTVAV